MWFCVRMHPKHGQLISKQLSGAQKHRIRFVGQLRVREATVRSAKTWEGGERKTVGKKKYYAQMPVSTWKRSEPESMDLAHMRK